jgi:hypothetical protein
LQERGCSKTRLGPLTSCRLAVVGDEWKIGWQPGCEASACVVTAEEEMRNATRIVATTLLATIGLGFAHDSYRQATA